MTGLGCTDGDYCMIVSIHTFACMILREEEG
jgi:hypothetical protein